MSDIANPSIATSSFTRQSRIVIALCFLVLVLENYDLSMFGGIVPALLDYEPWALTPNEVSSMASLGVAGMLVGALSTAALADRFGRRKILIGAIATFSVAIGLSAAASTLELFGLMRFAVGIGAGALTPTATTMLVEIAPPGRRNLATALGFAGLGVGGITAGLLAAWLVPHFGFRSMCVTGFLPALVVLPLALRFLPESPAFAAPHSEPLAPGVIAPETVSSLAASLGARIRAVFGAGRAAGTVLFWMTTFCCMLVGFGASTWLPALLHSAAYGIGSSLLVLSALNIGTVAGPLALSPLADRFGPKPVVAGAFCAAALAVFALCAQPPIAVVYVLAGLIGVGSTGNQTMINSYVGFYYPAPVRATGLGLSMGIGRFGGVVGPLYLSMLITAGLGFNGKFLALAAPTLFAVVLVALIPAQPNQKSTSSSAPRPTATDSFDQKA